MKSDLYMKPNHQQQFSVNSCIWDLIRSRTKKIVFLSVLMWMADVKH